MEDMVYIEDLLKFYLKKIGIVILTTLLFLELGVILKGEQKPKVYQESTTIILVNPAIDPSDSSMVGLTIGNLDNYLILLDSKKLTNNVISNLQLDETTTDLQEKATFTMSTNSQMITITVTDESDELAAKIANTYVEELKKEVKSIYKIDNIMVLDRATPTNNYIASNDNKTLILAIVGFIISSGIIIGIYCFNDNVRIMLRKENIFGAELLKTVFYTKKSTPLETVNENKERFTRIKSIICKLLKENKVKTIMITSDGNKFQSHYSANIANAFTNITSKTLLIDCNQYGGLSNENTGGMLDLITCPTNVFSTKLKKYIKKSGKLDILPLGNREKNNPDLFSDSNFVTVLDKLKSQYDLIFVEVPDITNSFEGMILSDLMDTTIIAMPKSKITKKRVKQIYDKIDKEKNTLLAIAPIKKKSLLSILKQKIKNKKKKQK